MTTLQIWSMHKTNKNQWDLKFLMRHHISIPVEDNWVLCKTTQQHFNLLCLTSTIWWSWMTPIFSLLTCKVLFSLDTIQRNDTLSNTSCEIFLATVCWLLIVTLFDVLHHPSYPSVEGSGIRRALEGQAKLLVVNPPVMEDGVDFIILQIPAYDALQNHLNTPWGALYDTSDSCRLFWFFSFTWSVLWDYGPHLLSTVKPSITRLAVISLSLRSLMSSWCIIQDDSI